MSLRHKAWVRFTERFDVSSTSVSSGVTLTFDRTKFLCFSPFGFTCTPQFIWETNWQSPNFLNLHLYIEVKWKKTFMRNRVLSSGEWKDIFISNSSHLVSFSSRGLRQVGNDILLYTWWYCRTNSPFHFPWTSAVFARKRGSCAWGTSCPRAVGEYK